MLFENGPATRVLREIKQIFIQAETNKRETNIKYKKK